MALTFWQRAVKRFNQAFANFREKSTLEVEDFELEHFLLYHGLIGSSPEGQRAFKDVRSDILAAVKNESSLQMGIALKLMPLFWEDKLKAIVAEIKDTQKEAIINCLMPDNSDGMLAPNQNPPFAEDWRARANAATLIAYVGSPGAVDVLTKSLNDTAGSARNAFCHTVLALAQTKNPDALKAIEAFAFDDEPWFRVDCINAISQWPFSSAAEILAEALCSVNNLSDYAAVAAARHHKPSAFLKDSRPNVQNGGMAMILALCSPNHKAFPVEQILPFDLASCFEDTIKLASGSGSALRIRAALNLIEWLSANRLSMDVGDRSSPDVKRLEEAKASLLSAETRSEISKNFSRHTWQNQYSASLKDLEGACLIELIGEFKNESHIEKLQELAEQSVCSRKGEKTSLYANAAIDAIGKIGNPTGVDKLINIAKRLVNQNDRATKAASSQPVAEDNPEKSLAYWHILNALGNLKSTESFDFLLPATQDFAPDKRQKALCSLVSVGKSLPLSADKESAMKEHLRNAFKDSSTLVKQAAIESAGWLGDAAMIEDVAAMIQARETSLWKEASRALKTLCEAGHKDKVVTELNKRLAAASDQVRRDRLSKLANELK